MFLVLQQIEGNLIYPHVVGSSVGLPSIWVLAAVTLGGSLMGVLGMLLFIPLCSVVYSLFRAYVKDRLRRGTCRRRSGGTRRLCPPGRRPKRRPARAPKSKDEPERPPLWAAVFHFEKFLDLHIDNDPCQ